ncbi:MAG: hypothetical protein AAGH99_02495 [Planctomycetota bacterium]
MTWSLVWGSAAQDAEDAGSAEPSKAAELVADEATTLAAIQLFNDAVTVQADGKHNRLLRALRHLEDPALGPLFAGLSRASHPSLQIHGWLGVAELSQPRGLTLAQITAVDRHDVQAELIGAALDGELIHDDTRTALLGWSGLRPGVKLLLATPHVAAGEFDADTPGFAEVVASLDNEAPGQRGLAGLLLTQLDDPRGNEVIERLIQETQPSADAVQGMLLETAWAHGLTGVASWAYELSVNPDTPPRLEVLALKAAIRFGDPRAEPSWAKRLNDAEEISRRTRLAWLGLEAAPWLSPHRFDAVAEDADPLIAQLGRTGRAVALTRAGELPHPELEALVIELIETGHPEASRWASGYAEEVGSASLAAAVVTRTLPGKPRGRARRLNAVVQSTQTLLDLEPTTALELLPTILTEEDADPAWQRGVLLGLIRCRSDAAREVGGRLPEFADPDTEALSLALRLQRDELLSEEQNEALSAVLRGGAELDDSLRVQMAWAYLQRTGQGRAAIAAVLAEP